MLQLIPQYLLFFLLFCQSFFQLNFSFSFFKGLVNNYTLKLDNLLFLMLWSAYSRLCQCWRRIRKNEIINKFIIFVISYKIFFFNNNFHSRKHIQRIIYSSLHIFEINFITKSLIKLKNLICYLRPCC